MSTENTPETPIRIIFLGTPDFSTPCLQTLLDANNIETLGVVTQPDKPVGRKQTLTPPPVKTLAEANGLKVFQPKSIRKDTELLDWLRAQAPDFFVTIAFGQILSQDVLDIPRIGTINVHASLLPEYRGANPIQWAIIDGKSETGITTMLTDIGIDTGDILLKDVIAIEPNETAGELFDKLSNRGGALLLNTLRQMQTGQLTSTPQEHDKATHARKISKADAPLDWSQSAQSLHDKIRGQYPWPGTQTTYDEKPIKLIQSRILSPGNNPNNENKDNKDKPIDTTHAKPGDIVHISDNGIFIQVGTAGANEQLLITQLQPAGKKAMAAKDWANGVLSKHDTADGFPRFITPKSTPKQTADKKVKANTKPVKA